MSAEENSVKSSETEALPLVFHNGPLPDSLNDLAWRLFYAARDGSPEEFADFFHSQKPALDCELIRHAILKALKSADPQLARYGGKAKSRAHHQPIYEELIAQWEKDKASGNPRPRDKFLEDMVILFERRSTNLEPKWVPTYETLEKHLRAYLKKSRALPARSMVNALVFEESVLHRHRTGS
ncbi:hypothetical protein [Hydrocarboniphaga effusa]|uniref:hypothetical protein n=1 Tax=Hydrocarboniphaga effusa TaxID=243629 RepID=UPI003137BF43